MDYINAIYIVLACLFVKHWYVDFVDQSMDEVHAKGIYLRWAGVRHSLKQGIGTLLMIMACGFGLWISAFVAFIDFLVHYHVDWTKMNYSNRDITNPQFWNHLGLDQLAHYITYLIIVWILF